MRILIVRLSHLGDVVHALGVFHALREAQPRARIAWAIQPEFAPLIAGLDGLSGILLHRRRDGWQTWPRMRADLSAFHADLAVDCQGNLKSAAVMLLSGAKRRVGLAQADWREPLGARVLTAAAAPLPRGAKHAMDRMSALVRILVPSHCGPLRLDAGLSGQERHAGERALEEHLPRAGTLPVLLHLSRPGDVRTWPLERWEALAKALARKGRGALVLSGPTEQGAGHALQRRLTPSPFVSHWVGQRGLRSLAALFEAAAARGLAFAGCDSGPTHLAAASGLAVVHLAGPQDPQRTGPWPLGARSPHVSVSARQRPACQPCLARRCSHAQGPVCMSAIEASDVLSALRSLESARAPLELCIHSARTGAVLQASVPPSRATSCTALGASPPSRKCAGEIKPGRSMP